MIPSPSETRLPEAPPKPQITTKGIGLATLFWGLHTFLYGLLIAQSANIPFAWSASGQLVANGFLAIYSVPAWWITVRTMNDTHWGGVLAAHIIICPLYAWVGLESYFGMYAVFLGAVPEELAQRYGWIYFSNITLYVVQFALYHLVQNVHYLRHKEQEATKLMARARQQELAALKAQINPHFLFNTLNSISATLRHDPEQAREMIAKLAGMMRYALDSSSRDRVPLREEVTFARKYLALERHRFSDRLDATVNVDADETAMDTAVPPMVLQPLVENALRHGIGPSETGGEVEVWIRTNDNRILVSVEDTGVGPGEADPLSPETDGVGLTNTSTRLVRTFGSDASLHTTPNEPTGFTVWFSLPRNGTSAE